MARPPKDRAGSGTPAPDAISNEPVSIKATSPADVAELEKQIADLKSKLQISETARGEVEKAALAAAEAQGALLQREIQEVPTGKFKTVKRLDKYKVVGHKDDGREILAPVLKDVQLPTFFYKIDMPPVGGTDLKINGQPYFHGTVYEFDADEMRTVKEMVFRTWDHDRNISGSNENFYRKPVNATLRAGG